MRITALKPQRRHAERVNVYVDGEFRCGLALEIVQAQGLLVGDPVDEATLEALERKDVYWKAREAAYTLLAYRARTRAELRRRLLQKDFPAEVVDACVADLAERGYVDDASFAESFVRDRVRLRPRGPRRLVQELRARGVKRDVAESTVDEVFEAEAVSELELAREAAEGWVRRNVNGEMDRDAYWTLRRRFYGYLARRGFGGEAIRTVMDETLPVPTD